MDERQLKDILGRAEVPPADENARKQAINLALATFDEVQRYKQKGRKGFRLWGRLTGRSNSSTGRRYMNRRYIFSGIATVTVALFGIGIYGALDHYREAQLMDASVAHQINIDPNGPFLKRSAPPAERIQSLLNREKVLANALDESIEFRPDSSPQFSMDAVSRMLASEKIVLSDREASKPRFEAVGRDKFSNVEQSPVKRVTDEPVSTFSIDVDTASYAFVRRMLNSGVLPQKNAVRVEELVNYFPYAYPSPVTRDPPFRPTVTVIPSPWKKGNKLIHIGIKGYQLYPTEKPRSNLVFLLDVSGSMNASDKLPLVVSSMKLLLETLGPDDTVGIVVYAGAAGTVLEPTRVAERHKIITALNYLQPGGTTAGGAGIRQAYTLAQGNFDKKAVNRVILATDGDFNVGITDREELEGFIERKRKSGVFLSVLGFGQGNLNDHLMQSLAQNGNGVAAHIDTLNEARKVLVEEASSTLFPIAKDVKIQVEFNPKTVTEYRLIGYETRMLRREDFKNDKVDAGDIGAGHSVTAIYEITPVGGSPMIGGNRYQNKEAKGSVKTAGNAYEYGFLKIRYKQPKSNTSQLISTAIKTSDEIPGATASTQRLRETRWATAVAAFGQILKGGKYTADYSYEDVIKLARAAKGDDEYGYRAEFINLVRLAHSAAGLPRD